MSGRARATAILKTLAVLLVVAILYLVLRHIGFADIMVAMRRVSRSSVCAATLLYLSVFLLWSFRWQQLMRPHERKSVAAIFPILMASVFGNIITPGARVGGEPMRAHYMSRAFGGERSAYFGTILADKLGNAAVFMGFLVLSATFVVFFVPLNLAAKLVLAAAVLSVPTIAAAGLLLRGRVRLRSALGRRLLSAAYGGPPLRFLRRRFPTYQHFEDYAMGKLDNILSPVARAAGSPKALAKVITISGAAWILFCLASHVLFKGLGANISFPRVLVIVTISTFLGEVSISPGGAGFVETAMIVLCAAFGVERGTAAAVTLISRGIFYFCGLGLGGACMAALALIYGRRP